MSAERGLRARVEALFAPHPGCAELPEAFFAAALFCGRIVALARGVRILEAASTE